MALGPYILGIVAAVLVLVAIVELLRRSTLRERHAVWWLIGGVLALVIAVFPQTLIWASSLLGVAIPVNLVFFVAIGLLFLVSLQYGAELTKVEERLRTLGEESAFHEARLRALESSRQISDEQSNGGLRELGEGRASTALADDSADIADEERK